MRAPAAIAPTRYPVERLVEMENVSGMMRAEFLVVVLADGRRGNVVLRLRDVVRAPHADELRSLHHQIVPRHAERLDQDREVVRVARDDLQEAVLARDERSEEHT